MVRIVRQAAPLLLALLAQGSLASQVPHGASATAPSSMVLQLHRLPDQGIHPEMYARRRLTDDGEDSSALEGIPLHIGLGTHYTWVYAGTPPQRASVIVDTGSGILAFPCTGCDNCGDHTDKPFNASDSATLVHVTCAAKDWFNCRSCELETDTCAISQSYMEGSSWDATVVEDIVFLGGDSSFENEDARNRFGTHFKFGCQHKETGLFIEQVADGIMGLSNTDNHLVAKLHQENKILSKLFALCFGEDGGSMTVGEPDTQRHRGEIQYAKIIGDRSSGNFYNVHILDIRIGGKSIEADPAAYNRGRFIVDSGTTDSYLPRALKDQFMNTFEAVAGLAYHPSSGICKGYTDEQADQLPNIQFVLESDDGGNMTLEVSPSQYLLQGDNSFCGGVFLSEYSGGVIGANLMTNRDVIFDGGSQRVGFVDADCSYTSGTDAYVSSSPDTSGKKKKPKKDIVPKSATVAPTPAPTTIESSETDESTETPAPSTTASPTQAPQTTNKAASSSPSVETSAPASTEAADVATTTAPTESTPAPTSSASNATLDATTQQNGGSGSQGAESHPMVLTVVGTVLAVAFLVIFVASVRHKKNRKKKAQNWSRVNEEDDDDDELGLVEAEAQPHRSKSSKAKHQPLSDSADDDDDDDDSDSDSDDDDEVFKNEAHETKHDSRTLEQL